MEPVTVGEEVQGRRIGLWAMIREDVACVFQRDPAARTTFQS